jgi:predicted acyl esterase
MLRVEVSSSNFPRFDRNLNTGELRYVRTSQGPPGGQFVRATNVILHDAEHPSALILQIVPAN